MDKWRHICPALGYSYSAKCFLFCFLAQKLFFSNDLPRNCVHVRQLFKRLYLDCIKQELLYGQESELEQALAPLQGQNGSLLRTFFVLNQLIWDCLKI